VGKVYDPLWLSELAQILKNRSAKGNYEAALREWITTVDKLSNQADIPPFLPAFVYSNLGDNDQAFAWLNKAYQKRNWCVLDLKNDPIWDPIRSDPRFSELLKRVRLSS